MIPQRCFGSVDSTLINHQNSSSEGSCFSQKAQTWWSSFSLACVHWFHSCLTGLESSRSGIRPARSSSAVVLHFSCSSRHTVTTIGRRSFLVASSIVCNTLPVPSLNFSATAKDISVSTVISWRCYVVLPNILDKRLAFITARCTLVQSAVLRSHVVCLSVCLWRWWIVIT